MWPVEPYVRDANPSLSHPGASRMYLWVVLEISSTTLKSLFGVEPAVQGPINHTLSLGKRRAPVLSAALCLLPQDHAELPGLAPGAGPHQQPEPEIQGCTRKLPQGERCPAPAPSLDCFLVNTDHLLWAKHQGPPWDQSCDPGS